MNVGTEPGGLAVAAHLDALRGALDDAEHQLERCASWGARLAGALSHGARLLAAGNGGSAAEAQHLTAELVGRYRRDRRPLSALALHAETSSLTAIVNDYGPEEAFARQVVAHGRPGDHFLALSQSGRSTNLLRAARAAREAGLVTWALTGPAPNALADAVDEAIALPCGEAPVVQELHLVAVHLVCDALDAALADAEPR